jgi:hypothetical protein
LFYDLCKIAEVWVFGKWTDFGRGIFEKILFVKFQKSVDRKIDDENGWNLRFLRMKKFDDKVDEYLERIRN